VCKERNEKATRSEGDGGRVHKTPTQSSTETRLRKQKPRKEEKQGFQEKKRRRERLKTKRGFV
jgi:hypothetical protein